MIFFKSPSLVNYTAKLRTWTPLSSALALFLPLLQWGSNFDRTKNPLRSARLIFSPSTGLYFSWRSAVNTQTQGVGRDLGIKNESSKHQLSWSSSWYITHSFPPTSVLWTTSNHYGGNEFGSQSSRKKFSGNAPFAGHLFSMWVSVLKAAGLHSSLPFIPLALLESQGENCFLVWVLYPPVLAIDRNRYQFGLSSLLLSQQESCFQYKLSVIFQKPTLYLYICLFISYLVLQKLRGAENSKTTSIK